MSLPKPIPEDSAFLHRGSSEAAPQRVSPRLHEGSQSPPPAESPVDPRLLPIKCPLCPESDSDLVPHIRKAHPGYPFLASDFPPQRIQVCKDCRTVITLHKNAAAQHRNKCLGVNDRIRSRRAGNVVTDARGRSVPLRRSSSTPEQWLAGPSVSPTASRTPQSTASTSPVKRAASTSKTPTGTPPRSQRPMDPPPTTPTPSSRPPTPSPQQQRPSTPTNSQTRREPPVSTEQPTATPKPQQLTPALPLLGPQDFIEQPGVLRHLHPSLVRPFTETAGRLARTWIADQSELNLSHILGLVKYGLAPAMRHGNASVTARLAAYPNVPLPQQGAADSRLPDRIKMARSLIEAGFIGKAERALNDDAKVAPLCAETIATLQAKHPKGTPNPFSAPFAPNLPYPDLPDDSAVTRALRAFAPDTAPGVSGWTVKLMQLAANSDDFQHFLVTITSQIACGIATGQSLLCAARLTPLLKPDGGIRPVAVGELFYRLAMKSIFAANFKHDLLLPNQFGVGSKGGVEPIIQAVSRAAAGDPLFPYSHLFSLDLVNAFNDLRRHLMAAAIAKRSPQLTRLAAWAHNTPSPLLTRDSTTTSILWSEQGVWQGDPMSTLWFSLSICDTVQGLQDMLGPTYLVLAYLDDIFILAPSPDRFNDVLAHFTREPCPVRLNPDKCKIFDLRDIANNPVTLLGSCIGSQAH